MFENKVIITGRAYRPQVRTTKSGKAITTFGLSVYNGKDRDGKSTYCFIDCKYFDEANNLNGDVRVEGKLAFDVWEKEGKKNTKPIIIVDKLDMGDGGKEPVKQETELKDDEIPWD